FLRSIPDLPAVAGVLVDTAGDLLVTSDRTAARVSVFRGSTEALLAPVGVGPRPNGLALDVPRRDPFSFHLRHPPGTGCTASVVSIDAREVVATIPLPGRPRWAVFDQEADRVYVNIQDPAVILGIDGGTLSETGRIVVGSAGPHGLALIDGRLFCAADGGRLVAIEAATGHTLASLPLPGVPDVIMYDLARRLLFVAVGSPGTVSSFDIDALVEREVIETDPGAHTIGWDPATGQLYVFAPRLGEALVYREVG